MPTQVGVCTPFHWVKLIATVARKGPTITTRKASRPGSMKIA